MKTYSFHVNHVTSWAGTDRILYPGTHGYRSILDMCTVRKWFKIQLYIYGKLVFGSFAIFSENMANKLITWSVIAYTLKTKWVAFFQSIRHEVFVGNMQSSSNMPLLGGLFVPGNAQMVSDIINQFAYVTMQGLPDHLLW